MIKFISACIGVTFALILAFPFVQTSSFFDSSASNPHPVIVAENADAQDPFEEFYALEDEASVLNSIATAAGAEPDGMDFRGTTFHSKSHASFLDHEDGLKSPVEVGTPTADKDTEINL